VSRRARKFGIYGLSVLLMASVSIAVIPVVVSRAGAEIWAGVATAQSVAGFAAVLIAFGWGVTGPAAVAGADAGARGRYFAESVASRAWLFVFVTPVAVLIVGLVAPGEVLVNAVVAISLMLPSVGASWFFVGEGAPWRLLLLENLPRASGTVLGGFALVATRDPAMFAIIQGLGALVAVAISWRDVFDRYGVRPTFSPGAAAQRLSAQASGVVAAGTAALYVSLPLVAVASFAPGSTAVYALADKLEKFAISAFAPVLQIAQGYVPAADLGERVARARRAAALSVAIGCLAACGYILVMPLASTVLSGGVLRPSTSVTVPLGIVLGAVCVSAITGLACLTALGAVRQVAYSTVLGAAVGCPLIVGLGLTHGPVGIAWAAAISELLVAGYQLAALRRVLRRMPLPDRIVPDA
jgi:O-antigen/teichoic acid export membrane protein